MSYIDAHPLNTAFVANALERLAGLIVEQGQVLLSDAGVTFPSRATSTMLLLGERGGLSAADIAGALAQPHQLVSQRVDHLIGLGLVARVADYTDARRKVLTLTPQGRCQFRALNKRLVLTAAAFDGLFAEIGCDLSDVINRAAAALDETPLLDRALRLSPREVPA